MANQFPISNISSSALIATANRVQTRNTALDVLEKSLHFAEVCKPDNFQRQQGRIVEFYRPVNFSDASLTPAVEGDFPTGLSYNNRTLRYSMGNYTDYVMFSSAQMDFSPTPDLQDAGERLGYRGAKRVDDLVKAVIDAEYPGMAASALATYFRMQDCRNIRHKLKNASVKGQTKFQGFYPTLASPLVTYDLCNDPTSGGYIDVNKYQRAASTPVTRYPINDDHLTDVNNCYIIESNNVTVTTEGSTNYYSTYFMGEGGFGLSTLNVRTPVTKQNSPGKARFNVMIKETGEATKDDPTNEVGGFASYNIYMATGCLDGTPQIGGTYRGHIVKFQSTIA